MGHSILPESRKYNAQQQRPQPANPSKNAAPSTRESNRFQLENSELINDRIVLECRLIDNGDTIPKPAHAQQFFSKQP